MSWFIIALIAPLLWAFVNQIDKYLLSRYENRDVIGALILFSSLVGLFVAIVIYFFEPSVLTLPSTDIALLMLVGFLGVISIILYLYALNIEDVSFVVPWFQTIPLFGYVLGYIFLGEKLTTLQLIAGLFIVSGAVILSFELIEEKFRFKSKVVGYMLLSSLSFAISGILFKYVTVENKFWVSSFWEYIGLFATGILLYTFIKRYRDDFHDLIINSGTRFLSINITSEILTIIGNLILTFATLVMPITLAWLASAYQPLFVLGFSVLFTIWLPHINKENISRRHLLHKLIAVVIMMVGTILIYSG